ncbi:hypothetical protein BJV74DRAFT_991136 [Russula compacta]|nr:hypothetical protein BJV74DRAFT_991136 [Russula compacta]
MGHDSGMSVGDLLLTSRLWEDSSRKLDRRDAEEVRAREGVEVSTGTAVKEIIGFFRKLRVSIDILLESLQGALRSLLAWSLTVYVSALKAPVKAARHNQDLVQALPMIVTAVPLLNAGTLSTPQSWHVALVHHRVSGSHSYEHSGSLQARGAGGFMAPCMASGRVWTYFGGALFVSVGTDSRNARFTYAGRDIPRIMKTTHESCCSSGSTHVSGIECEAHIQIVQQLERERALVTHIRNRA